MMLKEEDDVCKIIDGKILANGSATRERGVSVIVKKNDGPTTVKVILTSTESSISPGKLFSFFGPKLPKPKGNGADISIIEGNLLSPSRRTTETVPLDFAVPETRIIDVTPPASIDVRGRTFAGVNVFIREVKKTGTCP